MCGVWIRTWLSGLVLGRVDVYFGYLADIEDQRRSQGAPGSSTSIAVDCLLVIVEKVGGLYNNGLSTRSNSHIPQCQFIWRVPSTGITISQTIVL